MNELSKRDLFYIVVFAILISVLTIIIFFALGGKSCSDLSDKCSSLSDLATVIFPTGHAVETTLYEDENGTLTMVTRDLGASVTIK